MRTLQLTINPVVPPGEVHESTDWEIASDSEFSNIVHVVNSTTDLVAYNATNISPNIDIYARGRMVTDLGTMSHFTATAVDVVNIPLVNMPGGQYSATGDSIFTTGAYVSIDATNTHSSTDWVISNIEDNSIIWESLADTVNLTTITIPIGILEKRVSYRMNARHNGSVIASAYGAKSFMIVTIADDNIVVIDAPLLTVEGEPNNVVLSPGLTTSAFNVSMGTDTHISTDWVIEDAVGTVVWQSLADTVNKLNIPAVSVTLVNGTPYVFRVRHNGAVVSSGWTSETHTTPVLPIITPPLLAVEGEPGDIVLSPTMTTSAFNVSTGTDVHISTDWVIEDTIGTVVWESLAYTVNKLNIPSPSITLVEGTPYVFRVRHNGSVVSSGWTSETHTTITLSINTWSSAANYPIAINTHSQSTLLDGGMLVVGGLGTTGSTNRASIYDPTTDVWTSAVNYPTSIASHSQSTLSDGRVLVVGGFNNGAVTNLAHIYDPVTDVWTSAANYPTVIGYHTQSTLLDGRVLVVGGRDATDRINLAHIYDPVTNIWTSAANYPTVIRSHSQSTLLNGRVLVVGGRNNTVRTKRAYIYNPVTNVWSSAANYPMPIDYHTQSTLIDGKVLVVSGQNSIGRTNLSNIYDPTTDVWSSAANYPIALRSHSQSTLLDGSILVVGGLHSTGRTNLSNIYTP